MLPDYGPFCYNVSPLISLPGCVYSMTAVQNLAVAIGSMVAGVLVEKSGYIGLEVFFIAILCITLIAGEGTLEEW